MQDGVSLSDLSYTRPLSATAPTPFPAPTPESATAELAGPGFTPAPQAKAAPVNSLVMDIYDFTIDTPHMDMNPLMMLRLKDEVKRACDAIEINSKLEFPDFIPPMVYLSYPQIKKTSWARTPRELADEFARYIENLWVENLNRLCREARFYYHKNGWCPWEENNGAGPDEFSPYWKKEPEFLPVPPYPVPPSQPQPEAISGAESAPVASAEAEYTAPEARNKGVENPLEHGMREAEENSGLNATSREEELDTDLWAPEEPAPTAELTIETDGEPTPENKKPLPAESAPALPYLDKKSLIRRELEFLFKKGILTAKAVNTLEEGPDDYKARELLRRNVLTLKQAEGEIDRVTALSVSKRRELYSRLSKLEGEDIYFDDPSLYAMLTLTHGPSFAKDFAQYRENIRQLLEEIAAKNQERDRMYIELQNTSTEKETNLYIKRRDAGSLLNSQISALKVQFDNIWKAFTLKHSFTEMVPNKTFRKAQSDLGDLWAARLKDPVASARLRAYAQKAVDTLPPSRQLTDADRKRFHAALIELLEAVQKVAGMEGSISIKPFEPDDPRDAYAQSRHICFNANKLLENGKVKFADIITNLFHETAHVIQNKMSSRELEENFGLTTETADYYMEAYVSISAYRLQAIESHAYYMGTKATDITKNWPD